LRPPPKLTALTGTVTARSPASSRQPPGTVVTVATPLGLSRLAAADNVIQIARNVGVVSEPNAM
jgi:hypothetical protein